MLEKLISLANALDSKGLTKEADYLDNIIKSAMDEEESSEDYVPLRIQMGKPEEETYEMAPEDLIEIVEEDGRYAFSGLPVTEVYDEGYDPSDLVPSNQVYRFNQGNKARRDAGVKPIDFFPGFEGSEEEFEEKYNKEDPDIMSSWRRDMTGRDINRMRRIRRKNKNN